MQPEVRGWLLGSVDGKKGLVPYNYIKVLGKRRGQPKTPQSVPALTSGQPTTSNAFTSGQLSSNIPSAPQSLDDAFSQSQIDQEPLPTSGYLGSDMDTAFGDPQTEVGSNGQSDKSNMNAADILDKETSS